MKCTFWLLLQEEEDDEEEEEKKEGVFKTNQALCIDMVGASQSPYHMT
jgi:hypothetical protein